eukprot:1160385-Pelagomonas_calceolata.AAC.2
MGHQCINAWHRGRALQYHKAYFWCESRVHECLAQGTGVGVSWVKSTLVFGTEDGPGADREPGPGALEMSRIKWQASLLDMQKWGQRQ